MLTNSLHAFGCVQPQFTMFSINLGPKGHTQRFTEDRIRKYKKITNYLAISRINAHLDNI